LTPCHAAAYDNCAAEGNQLQSLREILATTRVLRRRSVLRAASAVTMLAASIVPVAPRIASAQTTRLTLGTALEGGSLQNYGAAFIDGLRIVDPLMEIRAVSTGGVQDNVALLEQGKLDLALVFGEVAHELFAGVGRTPTRLKVISVMY